jgi:hypothetical protein
MVVAQSAASGSLSTLYAGSSYATYKPKTILGPPPPPPLPPHHSHTHIGGAPRTCVEPGRRIERVPGCVIGRLGPGRTAPPSPHKSDDLLSRLRQQRESRLGTWQTLSPRSRLVVADAAAAGGSGGLGSSKSVLSLGGGALPSNAVCARAARVKTKRGGGVVVLPLTSKPP